ncbi:Uncharacterised protein [Moraxella caprae]|uniref:Uncharacterized protein n=1 Tax=Moraxella caprae TaxID=90240 RepID=A0A378R197_9GAMM|nr:Uncharacterised protein [Moraxella caprae]
MFVARIQCLFKIPHRIDDLEKAEWERQAQRQIPHRIDDLEIAEIRQTKTPSDSTSHR